jgi:enoyl-CoA hydratase
MSRLTRSKTSCWGTPSLNTSEKAVFGLPEVKLGLIPGFGGTQRLAKLVGASRAKELVFSGRQIKAQESKDLGIALEIYADKDQLLASCEAWFENTKKNSQCLRSRFFETRTD